MADPVTLTIISAAATAASVGSTIVSGMNQKRQLAFQEEQAKKQARLEDLRSKETAVKLREQLNRDLSSANASFASRGVVSTSGSAEQAKIEARKEAAREIDTAMFGGQQQASQLRGQAAQFSRERGRVNVGTLLDITGTVGNAYVAGKKKPGTDNAKVIEGSWV